MARVPSDEARNFQVPIWADFQASLDRAHGSRVSVEMVERFAFYERSKKAFAVVGTGEAAQYANVILKKGVVPQGQ